MNEVSKPKTPSFISRMEWALHLNKIGFRILPIRPRTKRSYQPWEKWEREQSAELIRNHWLRNPEDDIGIFTEGLYVADADHPASQAALNEIKERHGVRASISVKTRKGVHDYFALPPGMQVRQDSHSTENHPERIDVKTGRGYIIGPGSTDKTVLTWDVEHASQIAAVTQAFIDDIDRHNGRTRRPDGGDVEKSAPLGDAAIPRLRRLLEHISPDVGYLEWTRVGMAIFRETEGSDAGLQLYDSWSKDGVTYKGSAEIETKWRSFSKSVANPVTMGTLVFKARQSGTFVETEDRFEKILTEEGSVPDVAPVASSYESSGTPSSLAKSSLTLHLTQLAKSVQEQRPVMENLAQLGQSTVFYAAPNTGKTLISLKLIFASVINGDVNPEDVHYFNADDSGSGLLEKASLCERYGINTYGDGYFGISVESLGICIGEMIERGIARGKVLVADTLGRFVDTHNKGESRAFTQLIRRFTSQGGTFIALAHTRKNPGNDGKPVYAGTSDFMNDFDCAYMVERLSPDSGGETTTVQFTNTKRRGDVRVKAAYSYSNKPMQTYSQLLESVKPADSAEVAALERVAEAKRDSKIVEIIQSHIHRGINKKMELCKAVPIAANVSRAKVESILAKYAGTVPGTHHWTFTVQARGAHVYKLLPEQVDSAASQVPSSPAPQPTRVGPVVDHFLPYPDDFDSEHEEDASSDLEHITF